MIYVHHMCGNKTGNNGRFHVVEVSICTYTLNWRGTQDNVNTGKEVSDQHYIMLPFWSSISSTFKSSDDKAADKKPKDDTGSNTVEEPLNKEDQANIDELDMLMS
nr:hypothetical protein [Tanacetum cinerariifolium]